MTDNLVISNSLVQRNNDEHFNFAPVAGGIKITRTRGITVTDSVIRDNYANGLWFDESCYNMVVSGNQILDNLNRGMVSELSALGIVTDNVVEGNASHGILLEDTSNFQVWNNTFGANSGGRGIELYQDTRRNVPSTPGHDPRTPSDPTISWITSNIQIMNNVYAAGGQNYLYVADGTHARTASHMGVSVDGNLFTQPGQYPEIAWGTGSSTTTFRSAAAFTATTGQGTHNVDQAAYTPQTVDEGSPPVALPADVAAAAGEPTGTRHRGTF
jgi:trimeric autotransporter adhesin